MFVCHTFSVPIEELVKKRRSFRTFKQENLSSAHINQIKDFIKEMCHPPFNSKLRIGIIASETGDENTLKDLGTYGFIKNPAAFFVGTITGNGKDLEDFGYVMESAVLFCMSLGIGSCWLGGTFSKSAFAKRFSLQHGEIMPAVIALGYPKEKQRLTEKFIRAGAGSDHRKKWETLFFKNDLDTPLLKEEAGMYANGLELVRIAPSASNNQPWRIIQKENSLHFYLQRTKGYSSRNKSLFGFADLQRIDMGIALCHFSMWAKEQNIPGKIISHDPKILQPRDEIEYIASWVL